MMEFDDIDTSEFRKPRHRRISCSDRMCGAEDCPNCHPECLTDTEHEEQIQNNETKD